MKSSVNIFYECGRCFNVAATRPLQKRKRNMKTVFYLACNRKSADIGAWLVVGEYSICYVCYFEKLMSFISNDTSSSFNYGMEGKVLGSRSTRCVCNLSIKTVWLAIKEKWNREATPIKEEERRANLFSPKSFFSPYQIKFSHRRPSLPTCQMGFHQPQGPNLSLPFLYIYI